MLFNKKSKKNKRKFHVIDKGKRYQYSYQRDVYKNLISHFVKLQHLLCIFTASFFFYFTHVILFMAFFSNQQILFITIQQGTCR